MDFFEVDKTRHDFNDGFGKVPAHRHRNPDTSLGGWVADTACAEEGTWISIKAKVFGNARVLGNAWVYGIVRDDAEVSGNAVVGVGAMVADRARVCDDAKVMGPAVVAGEARVEGEAYLEGGTTVCGAAEISGNANVRGNAVLCESCYVSGWAVVDLPGKSGERFSVYAASASKRHGLLYPRAECRLTGL